TTKDNPVQDEKLVEKKKIEGGGKGSSNNTPSNDDDDVIYCAATDSLAILSKEQKASLAVDEEINKAFKPWLAFVLSHKDNKAKDGERMTDDEIAARVQAVYRCLATVSGIKDDQKARAYCSSLSGKISEAEKQILADIKTQKGSLSAGHKMNSGNVKEILRVGTKRAVWARNAYWDDGVKWQPRDQVIRQIREERAKAKQEAKAPKGPEKELEVKIFEKKLFEPIDNSLIPAVDKFFQDHCVNLLHGSKNFDASLSASVFRYTAESAFGATMNWKEQRTIKIGAKAEGSFSIAQASGTTSVHFPNKDGGDLLGVLRAVSPSLVKSSAEPLPFKLVLEIKGNAFVGACASASLEGGVSLKQNPDGGLNAGVELFAGAKANAEASLTTMVRLLSDEDRKKGLKPHQVDWAELTKATFGVWAAAGFGLEAAFKLGYFDKKWVYQVKAGIVVKGGCGAHIKGALDAQLMAKMAFHMANSVDWKGVGDLFDQAASIAFEAILYQCFTTGQTIRQAARELSDLNDQALSNIVHTASRSLNELKRVDDYLDHAIPGYSGYKKFQAPFLLLKGARTWAQSLSTEMTAKERAIYTVENANKNHLWLYATWKTKANLIFEMKLGGAGLLGFGEERKEEAIISVLNTIRHRDEFKKIQDSLQGRGVTIDSLVDGAEQDRLDAIRRKFGL
ncbi:MAG TPA: hypothetical protein PK208_06925, partial [Fibrobacteria bacterium]|nr:hypothetical protein [Fibrobacteria bacterium]